MLQSVPMMIQQPQQQQMKVTAIRGMAITQIVLGALSVVAGLSMLLLDTANYPGLVDIGYFGIPAMISGIWILVTGIIGLVSSRKPTSNCWNGTHMAFNIVAALLAFCTVAVLSIAIIDLSSCKFYPYYPYNSYYRYNSYPPSPTPFPMQLPRKVCSKFVGAIALAGFLVFFHVVDFGIALVSSILCCIYSCSGTNGCCAEKQKVYVTYQPQQMQQMYTRTSSAGIIIISAPPTSYPVSVPHYAPQSTAYYPNQAVASQANYTQAGATSVTYSTEQPPQYQEKVSTDKSTVCHSCDVCILAAMFFMFIMLTYVYYSNDGFVNQHKE